MHAVVLNVTVHDRQAGTRARLEIGEVLANA
jgi:hypothetical protein